MAISSTPTSAMILLLILFCLTAISAPFSSEITVSELSAIRSQSPNGVIHLTDSLLRRILSLPTPRPFHALIFFDAQQLHSKPELSLPTLKSEFSLVSSTFQSNNPNEKSHLFFFLIEFQESQSSFALFGVNSLPHIRLIPPTTADLKNDTIPMDASDYSRLAESMSEFIESRTHLSVGPIARPPIVSKKQIVFILAVVLLWTPFLIKKVLSGKTFLHEKNVWMAGAVFVYFFSVSGAMFNIIRKMPMFMTDRQDPSKFVYFYQGSGMQLGTEGFTVGFLYSVVGLLLAFVTHVLVKVKNRTVQRFFMIFVLLVSYWAVKKVIFLDNWKTGYGIHGYWPSSWQ
ncbi:putative dolichyl-diphosphooligosaccharide--protein glycosyltransferase subunit 3B [Orobanche gracilis]